MLLITDNLNVVRHVTERMAIMYLGRFIEEGPTGDVFHAPRHPYTRGLVSANPSPDPDRARDEIELHGEMPSLLRRPPGCEFHPRCTVAQEACRNEVPDVTESEDERRYRCHFPMAPPP